MGDLLLKSIENKPVSSVCHIFYDIQSLKCILVDPGSENPDVIDSFLVENHLHVDYIVLTHEHFDHIWSCNYFIEKYKAPIICSGYCADAILSAKTNLSLFYDQTKAFGVKPLDTIVVGNIHSFLSWDSHTLNFIDAGGHSQGGIIIILDQYVITGDTLIYGIKTVTKLKTGSKEKLQETLSFLESQKGKKLIVCPGHGEIFELDKYDLSIALGN